MDTRLSKRYHRLVTEHMNSSEPISAGLKALPDKISSFASTQAAWRFYANDKVSLKVLQEPLTEAAHEGAKAYCNQYVLCAHDWSRISYKHANKFDTYAITHATDVGYDLQSSLLLSDRNGEPFAPAAQRLVSADGSYSTYAKNPSEAEPVKAHLDELSTCITHLEEQGFDKPLVHIIDREGDSVGHIRQWQKQGNHWLVRAKDNPKVEYKGKTIACKQVAKHLKFKPTRMVKYHGKSAQQWVAEASVLLTRKTKPSQKKGPKPSVAGEPVAARLVVSRVLSDQGDLLAEWLLLTNVSDVACATIALWYDWRWKIESFFKLLKSAGHQLEAWQQESALAIAKRLLVVSMACVTVWAIAADQSPEAAELRVLLVKLSGRQMKRNKPVSHPALLAGLWVLLSMLEVMDSVSPEELRRLKTKFLGREDKIV